MAEKVVIGNAELWHGDALEVLREWQERRFDAVLTDPPYSSGGMVRGGRCRRTLELSRAVGVGLNELLCRTTGERHGTRVLRRN